jgi:FtsZ-interacting cell division protein ZipA
MDLDPVKPYADALKAIAIAVAVMVVAGALFMGGWALGRHQMDKQLAAKNTALLHASTSLDAAADALTAVNTEAQRRIAQAKTDKAAADKAAIAAQAAQHAAEARLAALQQHEQQARKRPGCAALLDTDLLQVCGL